MKKFLMVMLGMMFLGTTVLSVGCGNPTDDDDSSAADDDDSAS